ncbi:MAG: hypothetical protein NTW98_02370 [Candidatus Nomurabacteria bacterium]|nr:hypothetical protein [Candidatus Nomurabacteria bacterium]
MDFKSLATKFLNKKRELKKSSWVINPDIYWRYLIVLSAVLMVVLFAFAFYLFSNINSKNVEEENVNVVRLQTINKERLDNVIEYFSKREKVSENIIRLPSRVIDPSL